MHSHGSTQEDYIKIKDTFETTFPKNLIFFFLKLIFLYFWIVLMYWYKKLFFKNKIKIYYFNAFSSKILFEKQQKQQLPYSQTPPEYPYKKNW